MEFKREIGTFIQIWKNDVKFKYNFKNQQLL